MKETTRVAIFATHPIQYQAPLWRRLAGMPDFKIRVYYGTDMSVRGYKDEGFGVNLTWDTPLLEGYESVCLSTDPSVQQINFFKPNARGLKSLLDGFQPDVGIMVAYRSMFHLGAWRALRQIRVPIVMRHEATDVAHSRSSLKGRIRDKVLRYFYSTIDQFAYIGTEARRHLVRLGVPDSRLHHAPYCVDTDFVAKQVQNWLPQREHLRRELGIAEEDVAFVFSGKLIDKKDPLLIAKSLSHLAAKEGIASKTLQRIHILIAGDGALRKELENKLKAVIGDRAYFFGFLNQSEMGRAYAAADALILASKRGSGETWGLVVNEAMQYGLPAFLSDGVGCGVDLVEEVTTGKLFNTGDAETLSRHIRDFTLLDQSLRDDMRARTTRKAQTVSINKAVQGIKAAINSAHGRSNTK